MPAPRGRSETRQTPPGARPNRRAQPRFAGGRGALPSPRVGCMSRRATGGPRWMTVPAASAAGQNSAYRPPRWRHPRADGSQALAPISARRSALGASCPSPRPRGRCARPCRRCRSAGSCPGRPGGSAPGGRGRGTRPRTAARPGARSRSGGGRCSGGSGAARGATASDSRGCSGVGSARGNAMSGLWLDLVPGGALGQLQRRRNPGTDDERDAQPSTRRIRAAARSRRY